MVKVMKQMLGTIKKTPPHRQITVPKWAFPPLFAMSLVPSTACADVPAMEEKQEVAADISIPTLVSQLGDDSFQIRDRAMQELWSRGTPALPALRTAAGGKDPEVTSRASELVLYISTGVLPDTPEEIKKLVIQFSGSTLTNKLTIMRKLIELSQWKQVLHLAQSEKDLGTRSQMAKLVQEAASKAARDAIIAGDFKLATEVLELTGDDEQNMAMRAWFYVRSGKLEAELNKAAAMPGKKGALWRMSLHRAAGNLKATITEAEKAGLDGLAAGMRVFTGDALPLIENVGTGNQVSTILSMGYQLQKTRLLGQNEKANLIARELSRMHDNRDTASRAAVCLAANGFRKEAVGLLVKADANTAFEYFDNIESPHKSLEQLGIAKTAKPPFTKWVKNVTTKAVDERSQRDRLILLAGFLDRHGERDHALAVLRPIMQALEEDGADAWFNMLGQMRSFGLGWIAVTFAKERGDEDGNMDLSVKNILGSDEIVTTMWNALKKRHPEDLDQALHELALLAGIIADTDNETDKIHQAFVESVFGENLDPDLHKEKFTQALYSFAFKRNNAIAASRIVDRLAPQNNRWQRPKVFLDAALHRWEKVEPVYAKAAEDSPEDYVNLIKWCIALRKLDRNDAAEKAYDRALMLSMGNAEALGVMGAELSEAGYDDEASALWEHSAMMASFGSNEYERAILYLSTYGEHLYQTKQWQKAAAIHEVYTGILMRGRGASSSYLSTVFRARFYGDFSGAMHQLENGKRDAAIKKLDHARQLIPGDGSLADHFFPVLRTAGIGKTYDQWFEDSYSHLAAACKAYPGSHNTQNTAAWLASRAVRRLDDARRHAEAALKVTPLQGAYLDTMAEVWFARGDRAKAVEWSQKAVAASVGNAQGSPRTETQGLTNFSQLTKQLNRFKESPLPK